MNNIHIQYFKSPFGELQLASFQDKLCMCDWRYRKMRDSIDARLKQNLKVDFKISTNEIIEKAINQLEEYFRKERKDFDIPLLFIGTDFQKRVWSELEKISYGQTMTYLELSRKLGDEKAIRAVASANGANALAIFIPCHRIIGSKGELTGYAGGLVAKKKLLELEGSMKDNKQLSLFE